MSDILNEHELDPTNARTRLSEDLPIRGGSYRQLIHSLRLAQESGKPLTTSTGMLVQNQKKRSCV